MSMFRLGQWSLAVGSLAILGCLASVGGVTRLLAADVKESQVMDMSVLKLVAPETWVKKEPRTKIINFEYAAPASKDDKEEGRMTVSAAGGGIEANIDRWIGQFTQPDGKDTKDRAKISKKKISGFDVHIVDLSGTFRDQPQGPFGPSVTRPKYRMLAAIIVAPQAQIFVKFYGPERTIADHEKGFLEMVDGMKAGE